MYVSKHHKLLDSRNPGFDEWPEVAFLLYLVGTRSHLRRFGQGRSTGKDFLDPMAGERWFLKKMLMSSKFLGSHIWSGFPLVFWSFFKKPSLFLTKTLVSNLSGWKNAKVHFSLHLPIAGRLLGGSCEQCCALHCWNGSNGGSQVSRSLPGNRPLGDNGYRAVRKFCRNDWMTRMNPHKTSENSEKGDSQVFRFGMQGLCDWNVCVCVIQEWCFLVYNNVSFIYVHDLMTQSQ